MIILFKLVTVLLCIGLSFKSNLVTRRDQEEYASPQPGLSGSIMTTVYLVLHNFFKLSLIRSPLARAKSRSQGRRTLQMFVYIISFAWVTALIS